MLRGRLGGCDFAAVAPKLGLEPPDALGRLRLSFLGGQWLVDSGGVYLESGTGAHVNCKSVIIYYLTSGGHGQPAYTFRLLHTFTSGLFTGQNSVWLAEQGRTGIGTHVKFAEAAGSIGAWLTREGNGMYTWMMFAFPKLPVTLTFIEPDDEFEAQLLIKFDDAALTFLPFETLAVLNSLIAARFHPNRKGR